MVGNVAADRANKSKVEKMPILSDDSFQIVGYYLYSFQNLYISSCKFYITRTKPVC